MLLFPFSIFLFVIPLAKITLLFGTAKRLESFLHIANYPVVSARPGSVTFLCRRSRHSLQAKRPKGRAPELRSPTVAFPCVTPATLCSSYALLRRWEASPPTLLLMCCCDAGKRRLLRCYVCADAGGIVVSGGNAVPPPTLALFSGGNAVPPPTWAYCHLGLLPLGEAGRGLYPNWKYRLALL